MRPANASHAPNVSYREALGLPHGNHARLEQCGRRDVRKSAMTRPGSPPACTSTAVIMPESRIRALPPHARERERAFAQTGQGSGFSVGALSDRSEFTGGEGTRRKALSRTALM